MRQIGRLILVAMVLLIVPLTSQQYRPAFAARTAMRDQSAGRVMRISVTPNHINVGRDVILRVSVVVSGGGSVTAHISISGAGKTVMGTTSHGVVTVTVHATTLGEATVRATAPGAGPATLRVPIVAGPPASVVAIVHGVSILVPRAKAKPGAVGSDLFQDYHALTARAQLASLGMRDGTVLDLDSNTDVLIKDPLHDTINSGELFLEVAHGATSHQVQAGSAVAATKGTRFDVRFNPKTHTFVVTVIEGRVLVTNAKKATLVGAGQQTTVVGAHPPAKPKNVDVRAVVIWVKPLPNVDTATLALILHSPTPSPTATASFSATPTLTASPTATASFSATPTLTPLPTETASFSATPTFTASPTATASFSATPTLTPTATLLPAQFQVKPATVSAGGTVTVIGSGFQPQETVIIAVDGQSIYPAIAAADGSFSDSILFPSTIQAGPHTMTATGQTSGRLASTSITVAPPATPTSTNTPTATPTATPPIIF